MKNAQCIIYLKSGKVLKSLWETYTEAQYQRIKTGFEETISDGGCICLSISTQKKVFINTENIEYIEIVVT
jgi:hypothetical protein